MGCNDAGERCCRQRYMAPATLLTKLVYNTLWIATLQSNQDIEQNALVTIPCTSVLTMIKKLRVPFVKRYNQPLLGPTGVFWVLCNEEQENSAVGCTPRFPDNTQCQLVLGIYGQCATVSWQIWELTYDQMTYGDDPICRCRIHPSPPKHSHIFVKMATQGG